MSNPPPDATGEFPVRDEVDTLRLARALAATVTPGTTIGLIGTLGAGKTRFVQALAEACGVPAGAVVSPTYVLCQQYEGDRFVIHHLDVFRLNDDTEFLNLGVEELYEGAGVQLIEWADRVRDLLPEERLEIEIEVTGEQSRQIRVRAWGPSPRLVLNEWQTRWESSSAGDQSDEGPPCEMVWFGVLFLLALAACIFFAAGLATVRINVHMPWNPFVVGLYLTGMSIAPTTAAYGVIGPGRWWVRIALALAMIACCCLAARLAFDLGVESRPSRVPQWFVLACREYTLPAVWRLLSVFSFCCLGLLCAKWWRGWMLLPQPQRPPARRNALRNRRRVLTLVTIGLLACLLSFRAGENAQPEWQTSAIVPLQSKLAWGTVLLALSLSLLLELGLQPGRRRLSVLLFAVYVALMTWITFAVIGTVSRRLSAGEGIIWLVVISAGAISHVTLLWGPIFATRWLGYRLWTYQPQDFRTS